MASSVDNDTQVIPGTALNLGIRSSALTDVVRGGGTQALYRNTSKSGNEDRSSLTDSTSKKVRVRSLVTAYLTRPYAGDTLQGDDLELAIRTVYAAADGSFPEPEALDRATKFTSEVACEIKKDIKGKWVVPPERGGDPSQWRHVTLEIEKSLAANTARIAEEVHSRYFPSGSDNGTNSIAELKVLDVDSFLKAEPPISKDLLVHQPYNRTQYQRRMDAREHFAAFAAGMGSA